MFVEKKVGASVSSVCREEGGCFCFAVKIDHGKLVARLAVVMF